MDAFGAAMGALGLLAFALLAWLTACTLAWFLVSIALWYLWESFSSRPAQREAIDKE